MSWVRRELPIVVMSLVGFLIIVDYVAVIPGVDTSAKYLTNWSVILMGFGVGIGLLSVLLREGKRIIARDKNWVYSSIQLAFIFLTLGIGLVGTINHPYYQLLFYGMLAPLNVTISALLTFFIASAAYRVFKAKNVESALLLIAAIFVILKNVPGIEFIPSIPVIGDWILTTWAAGGSRGILIGAAIASVAFAVRLLLAYETRWLGKREQ